MLINGVGAILLISPDAPALAAFYRRTPRPSRSACCRAASKRPDHTTNGFAQVVTFRDPDGNLVEILEPIAK